MRCDLILRSAVLLFIFGTQDRSSLCARDQTNCVAADTTTPAIKDLLSDVNAESIGAAAFWTCADALNGPSDAMASAMFAVLSRLFRWLLETQYAYLPEKAALARWSAHVIGLVEGKAAEVADQGAVGRCMMLKLKGRFDDRDVADTAKLASCGLVHRIDAA
jgi:hypothetical protein